METEGTTVSAMFKIILFCFFPGTSHRFSNCCGKNITIKNNGRAACRTRGFSHGVVFSSDPLKYDEVFEVNQYIPSFFVVELQKFKYFILSPHYHGVFMPD